MKSREGLNKVQKSLSNIKDEIDDIYYSLRSELTEEIIADKIKQEKINKETNDIYDKLTKEICVKLVKKKLPLSVKLFNNIKWAGQGVKGNGLILICFNFNNSFNSFEYVYTIEEIKEYLKIK
jgi:hypothetical protein